MSTSRPRSAKTAAATAAAESTTSVAPTTKTTGSGSTVVATTTTTTTTTTTAAAAAAASKPSAHSGTAAAGASAPTSTATPRTDPGTTVSKPRAGSTSSDTANRVIKWIAEIESRKNTEFTEPRYPSCVYRCRGTCISCRIEKQLEIEHHVRHDYPYRYEEDVKVTFSLTSATRPDDD
ncbi:hypothetical protein GQ42DRAFT_3308 [Ramicandelaber brevisporus]|nr:hypothetical protein GQ42DRAFT_3308 [Ramicandelaber brevisporus]